MIKRLLFLVIAATVSMAGTAVAQTTQTYTTIASVAALKAITGRPAVVEITGSNPGVFNWSTTPCSAADDMQQITPTSGPAGCYTRMATPYSVGKASPVSSVLISGGTGTPAFSTTLPAVDGSALTGVVAASIVAGVSGTTITGTTNSNGVLYNSSNRITNLASANNAALATSSAGVPSMRAAYPVDVRAYGAVCDGATNDASAITTALATGYALTSQGLTCAVSGDIALPGAGAHLQNFKFKQLTPNVSNRRTLYYGSGSNGPVTLIDVTVDRNGSPTDSSTITDAAGIWIAGEVATYNSKVYLENVEVFGDGPGSGIVLAYTDGARIVSPYIHDIRWLKAVDPCTEQVIGIWAQLSTNMLISGHKIQNLLGSVTAGVPSGACAAGNVIGAATYTPYQSDGITSSANIGLTISNGLTNLVGEGIDVTGTGPNINVWLYGNSYVSSGAIGEKWYHDVYNSGSVGSRSYGSGLFGLAIGGTVGPDLTGPLNLNISDFIAINTGANGYWSGATQGPTGIASPETMTAPANIQCVNCQAIDTGSTMKWGFYNHMNSAAALSLVNSYVSGATTAEYFTFPAGSIFFKRDDQSLTITGPMIAASYNGNTITTGTGTLTLAASSSLVTSGANSITLTSTGATNVTLPTTGTIATLAGAEAFTNKTYNGNTWTAGTGTLTLGAGKTATISNTLTLTATDGSTLAIGTGGTLGTAAYKATGTSGNTVPLLDGANTWSASQTTGSASNRVMTANVSGGSWTGNDYRYDDGTAVYLANFRNYSIDAINQGAGMKWFYGTGGSQAGNAAATIDILSTADWSAAGNRSTKFRALTLTADSAGIAWEASTALFTVPTALSIGTTLTYGGVTLAGSVTGTGSMALSASPTFTGTVGAAGITATGTIRANTGFNINGTAGASCGVGTLNPVTAVVTNGLITTC